MICFPNAKINIGLHVLSKRNDGFHDIESLILPIPFFDVLEFGKSAKTAIKCYGFPVQHTSSGNTVMKAWEMMHNEFGIPPLEIHLIKSIPPGSGLGGGSSDAAFFIKAVNVGFGLNLTHEKLLDLSANIGSDCPFFIQNMPAIISGRGETVNPVDLNFSDKFLVLVIPDVVSSTQATYKAIKPSRHALSVIDIIRSPAREWSESLKNDFEDLLFQQFPFLAQMKLSFYEQGAFYASMSGTGSAVYGLFDFYPDIDQSKYPGTVVILKL